MAQAKPKNIVIVGGSLGGLMAGVALKHLRKDLNIRIFERNPTPLLQDQGAGVVAGPKVQKFFETHDRTHTPLTVPSHQRQYLDKEGKIISRHDQDQHMTSWDLLYHLLRTNYDGTKTDYAAVPTPEPNEGTTSYEYGCTVTSVAVPSPDFSNPIQISYTHTSGTSRNTPADLVLAADGPSSQIRTSYFPSTARTYAGYIAWRGTLPETSLSTPTHSLFTNTFTFYHAPGTQILAYTIPGSHGTTAPGQRLLNWVWYVNAAQGSKEHEDVMTDVHGRKHHVTLPPGAINPRVWERQKKRAEEMLPPQFAEVVRGTEVPFVQAITDVIAPAAVLEGGRVVLLGDALAGFRPHTAASTNQAALGAMALAGAVERLLGGEMVALGEWEAEVMRYAVEMQRRGVEMGDKSQFGEHEMQR
ncbi:hypothetical protein COCC4DRAFT_147154 [Bipolaris maydis ATCC 48331]|uniref:2,6-dihydroxypyridine 3-monooxygenase substrate binding domain-containing protein n=2 Tax=Cochliobolus heterostrophus TaxID=5016 RepID=M2U8K6_COCH5|nr:uncharacterized protein COCC4DRAFT_147154 [Bipolaris maydis ATCC 48331]EMD94874.1 hypothetical protein COCHEDRAFT_1191658 [Bipolaris maydis C5]KAH7555942.1 hypothetical protein BM1_06468 [Bipolaris maydis]ENI01834.1 hypothetical protein COCC4DRAFT_147154 [Bipolaris maydis ATCC 48331]KAJ5029276.1 hypothetical protein J3E73DRAFT_226884 [Bipolaris maydis]KAJ5061987.1 monooxygenase [Bipolaris maydis]